MLQYHMYTVYRKLGPEIVNKKSTCKISGIQAPLIPGRKQVVVLQILNSNQLCLDGHFTTNLYQWGSPSASDPRAKNTGQRATKGTVLTSQRLSPWCDCHCLGSTLASWRWQDINVGNPLWRRTLLVTYNIWYLNHNKHVHYDLVLYGFAKATWLQRPDLLVEMLLLWGPHTMHSVLCLFLCLYCFVQLVLLLLLFRVPAVKNCAHFVSLASVTCDYIKVDFSKVFLCLGWFLNFCELPKVTQ